MIKYYTGKDLRILVEVWLVQSVLYVENIKNVNVYFFLQFYF